jgi:hypothetical protein
MSSAGIDLVKEAVPSAQRFALFMHPDEPIVAPQIQDVERSPSALFETTKVALSHFAAHHFRQRCPPVSRGRELTCLSEKAKQLLAFDRYEQRARSKRKSAIRGFDATQKQLRSVTE